MATVKRRFVSPTNRTSNMPGLPRSDVAQAGRARADEPQSTKNVRLSARHVATWFATDSEGWKLSNDGSGRHAFIRF